MIFTAFSFLFPPLILLKGLRHWVYGAHIAIVAAAAWWRFPSLEYSVGHLYHPYYLMFFGQVHLVSITLLTFFAYGWDKRQAKRSGWRVPESTLHALAFVGGTVGAFVGSKFFRHKTIKGQFRQMFWVVVILQCSLVIAVIWFT